MSPVEHGAHRFERVGPECARGGQHLGEPPARFRVGSVALVLDADVDLELVLQSFADPIDVELASCRSTHRAPAAFARGERRATAPRMASTKAETAWIFSFRLAGWTTKRLVTGIMVSTSLRPFCRRVSPLSTRSTI